jgi:triphosphatase
MAAGVQNGSTSILRGARSATGPQPPAVNPVEIELKFQVPPPARERLRRALATASAQTVRLQAVYADTADQRLVAAGMALRLRQEGGTWVQTLKGRGDGLMTRLEHEVHLPAQRGTPALDPARHAGTPAGDALAALLADGAPLEPRYRTDIRRLWRRVRSGSATIEIAFDEGHIAAGPHRLPVCELELELVAGPPAALLALAGRWVERHGLWLDVRTKSERGHRLALGLHQVPAVLAEPINLTDGVSPGAAFAAMLQSALAQLLPNAAEVAAGSGGAEALHQLRVAIRRLRTVLHLAGAWSGDAEAARALEARWREPFTRLGEARDADVLAGWLLPALAAAGAPPLRRPARHGAADPGAVVREPGFTQLVLQTLQAGLAATARNASASAPLPDAAQALLKRAWRRLCADAAGFAAAAEADRHRTRKRLKRLRYITEFLLPLLPQRAARRALARMRRALDALGVYNDLLVAQDGLRQRVEHEPHDPHAWFALGWLAAQHALRLAPAHRRLEKLARGPRFWR